MFCSYCGKEILDDSKYCSYCGKKQAGLIRNVSSKFKKTKVEICSITLENKELVKGRIPAIIFHISVVLLNLVIGIFFFSWVIYYFIFALPNIIFLIFYCFRKGLMRKHISVSRYVYYLEILATIMISMLFYYSISEFNLAKSYLEQAETLSNPSIIELYIERANEAVSEATFFNIFGIVLTVLFVSTIISHILSRKYNRYIKDLYELKISGKNSAPDKKLFKAKMFGVTLQMSIFILPLLIILIVQLLFGYYYLVNTIMVLCFVVFPYLIFLIIYCLRKSIMQKYMVTRTFGIYVEIIMLGLVINILIRSLNFFNLAKEYGEYEYDLILYARRYIGFSVFILVLIIVIIVLYFISKRYNLFAVYMYAKYDKVDQSFNVFDEERQVLLNSIELAFRYLDSPIDIDQIPREIVNSYKFRLKLVKKYKNLIECIKNKYNR